MNEFEGKTKDQLEKVKFGMEAYLQGVIDTWKIFDEIFEKSLNFYKGKIERCDEELKKHKS